MRHGNVALFVPHAGCPHRCSFCDQRAISGTKRPLLPDEVTAACTRALATRRCTPEAMEIAFFGGSFTAMDENYIRSLLCAAAPFVERGLFAGIRVSTRPDSVDAGMVALLKSYGVTTVELGAQSMDDRVLAANGRGHTVADVAAAARRLKEAGLRLGLQMMTGLYGDTDDGAWHTARELAALAPAFVRIYPTLVLRGTRLAALYAQGKYRPQTLAQAVGLGAGLLDFFETQRHIPVIRLGLQAGADMKDSFVAGPWHPAFRELCEGRLYVQKGLALLRQCLPEGGEATLWVAPRELSKAIGHRRANLEAFAREGYRVCIKADPSVPPRSIFVSSTEREPI